jgi:hypothetical protein
VIAHHDGLQPTQHTAVWSLPPQCDSEGPTFISRTASKARNVAYVIASRPSFRSWPTGGLESAGRVKSTRTRPGNPYLKNALGVAALSASHSHGTYYSPKYKRIASRRGPVKAVALEHAMLIAIWNMLGTGEGYRDPGDDFYTRRSPENAKLRAIAQLERLGYVVSLEPVSATG